MSGLGVFRGVSEKVESVFFITQIIIQLLMECSQFSMNLISPFLIGLTSLWLFTQYVPAASVDHHNLTLSGRRQGPFQQVSSDHVQAGQSLVPLLLPVQ